MTMTIKNVIGVLKYQAAHLQQAIHNLEQADGGSERIAAKITPAVAKSHMSTAARRAQSARMTKYWAARRRAKAKAK